MVKNCMKITKPTFWGQSNEGTWRKSKFFWQLGGSLQSIPLEETLLSKLFFIGRSGFPTKGGTGEKSPHSCPKFYTSPFTWMSPLIKELSFLLSFMPHPAPPLIVDYILENYIFNSLKTNLTQNFDYGAHFQFHNHDLFEKVYQN